MAALSGIAAQQCWAT